MTAAAFLGPVSASRAQTGAWTNSVNGNWSATTNWLGGVVANGSGNTAYFTNVYSAVPTITLDTARTNGNLTFGNASGYISNNVTISGSQTLTLTKSGSTPVITCWPLKSAGNSACIITCPLSGNQGLTKSGTGSLWLEANNQSLSGPLTIAQGRLFCYANGNALANVSSVVISNGCYLDFYNISVNLSATNFILNGMGATQDGQLKSTLYSDGTTTGTAGSFTINGTVTLNATSDIGGSSPAQTNTLAGTVTGPGGLVKDGTAGTLVLANANTYAGGTTVSAGLVKAQVAGSLGSGGVVVATGATLELDNPSAMSSTANLFLLGATNQVNLNFSGTQIINSLSINGGYCAAGTWGAVGSSAANQSAALTNSGILNVSTVRGPTSGVWNMNASGNWSSPFNWLSNSVAAGAGNTAYFTNIIGGAWTVTLDTAQTVGNLVFGQAGAFVGYDWTMSGSQTLTLTNPGSAPVITCWPLLAAGNSSCVLTCPLSGSQGLTKWGTGSLWLEANNQNLSGPLTIAQGRVFCYANGNALTNVSSVVISNGCYLDFYNTSVNLSATNFILNGMGAIQDGQLKPTLYSDGTFTGSAGSFTINGTVTLNATSDIGGSSPAQTNTLAGTVTGPGGLVKDGVSGTLVLAHINTYAGETTVSSGLLRAEVAGSLSGGNVGVKNGATLELDNPAAMSSSANLFLEATTNAVNLSLNFSGTQTINTLYLSGSYAPAGTYGAVGSAAANQIASFSGTGMLNVTATGVMQPASSVWNVNASGIWSDPINWLSNTVATGAGNTAYFTNIMGGALTVTLDTAQTVGNLAFGQAGAFVGYDWTVGGLQILTLDNAGNPPVITCWPLLATSNSACTITCPLSGSLGLVKQGTGTLWLNGNNLGLNGTLVIAQGRVFNNIASGYGLGNMDVVISNGCYLSLWQGGTFPQNFTLNGLGGVVDGQQQSALMASSESAQGNFTIDGTVTLNATSDIGGSYSNQLMVLNGQVTGPGGLVKNGKNLSGSVGPGTLQLANGANDYAGGTWVNGGLLQAQTAGSLGSGDVTVTNGAALELDDPAAMNSAASLYLLGTTSLVNLNFSGVQTINMLSLNGNYAATGTWGAVGSGAANQSSAFTGSGWLSVNVAGVPLSTNAYLASLAITPAGNLSPGFTTNGFSYTATNAYANNPIQVTAASADTNAMMSLSFNSGTSMPLTNNLASGNLTLNLLPSPVNTVVVQVVSPDLTVTNTYSVSVLLQPSLATFTLTNRVSGGINLALTWPVDHTGYELLVQTNNLTEGISRNPGDWGSLGFTATNAAVISISQTNLNEYYRLVYP